MKGSQRKIPLSLVLKCLGLAIKNNPEAYKKFIDDINRIHDEL